MHPYQMTSLWLYTYRSLILTIIHVRENRGNLFNVRVPTENNTKPLTLLAPSGFSIMKHAYFMLQESYLMLMPWQADLNPALIIRLPIKQAPEGLILAAAREGRMIYLGFYWPSGQ